MTKDDRVHFTIRYIDGEGSWEHPVYATGGYEIHENGCVTFYEDSGSMVLSISPGWHTINMRGAKIT